IMLPAASATRSAVVCPMSTGLDKFERMLRVKQMLRTRKSLTSQARTKSTTPSTRMTLTLTTSMMSLNTLKELTMASRSSSSNTTSSAS
ncbi:hypothetical protein KXW55_000877, partial [Aspergillus fumigatus]